MRVCSAKTVHVQKVSIHVFQISQIKLQAKHERHASLNSLFPDINASFNTSHSDFFFFLKLLSRQTCLHPNHSYIECIHTQRICERHLCNIKLRVCGRVLWPDFSVCGLRPLRHTVAPQQLPSVVVTEVGGDRMIFHCFQLQQFTGSRGRRTDLFIFLHFNIC